MPPQKPARVLRIETAWIREYARTYLPSEVGFSFSDDDLRASGITLIAVRHVLSKGYAVRSEKLNGPGAIWTVEGQDNEGIWYQVTIKVISEQLDVTLINAEQQQEIQEVPKAKKIKRAATE
ncbi:MAG TPA: hypothetical protein VN941_01420 [Bradyrhizobium sp.]|nr:hypothetical protein [Bradyrhizobium sp.]